MIYKERQHYIVKSLRMIELHVVGGVWKSYKVCTLQTVSDSCRHFLQPHGASFTSQDQGRPVGILVGILPGLRSAWINGGKGHAPKTRRRFQELYGNQP